LIANGGHFGIIATGVDNKSVDGSHIEDVTVSNITVRDGSNAPIFIRLGSGLLAPGGTAVVPLSESASAM